MRREWIADGLTNHGYNFDDLKQVSDNYERLDLIPTHYNFPVFFCHDAKPVFVEKIERAKERR